MKIAVTDACIFIDLIELHLTSEFFGLQIEIHTSLDVFNELYPEQQELLKAYQSIGRLIIHKLTNEDKIEIQEMKFPRSLSFIDISVIFLAGKHNAMILSSDKAVRHYAGSKAIEYHGMLWIFDRLIELKLIDRTNGVERIQRLLANNLIYRNNGKLAAEIKKRIERWS